ncbi:MAG: pentapeptide repeat-containing protein, partial [SAR202 cluster bacterium]|nr:pentapeptide repeat-containing protein [SAR202 cluster bacterium]
MGVTGLRTSLDIRFLVTACVVAMVAMVLGCGGAAAPVAVTQESAQAAQTATATVVKRDLRGDTVGEGTPIAKAGTPDVQPLPDRIGDCVLEPGTDCQGADLRGAHLGFRANSTGAGIRIRLKGANFQNADFTGADLYNADFTSADLRGANLTDTNIAGANMYQADLRGANLTGADLSFADLEDAKLDGAIYCNTIMPD